MQHTNVDGTDAAPKPAETSAKMRVGFVGLGRMGSGMVERLLAAGHAVTVHNRTPEKTRPLASQGAIIAKEIADTCGGDAVVTVLADDAALDGVAFGAGGLIANLPPGGTHVSMSTIGVALAERLVAAHREAGQAFVSAPVFGRPDAAAAGKLFIVAAGAGEDLARCAPLFEAMGQKTFAISDEPPAANLVKLSGNFLIAAVIESLGEAMALVGKAGIDKHQYLELLTSTLFGAPVYKTYGTLIADEKFSPPGFAAPLGLKDVRLTLAAGDDLRVPLPLASLLRDRYLTLLANGGENLDWSAIGALAAKDAGSK